MFLLPLRLLGTVRGHTCGNTPSPSVTNRDMFHVRSSRSPVWAGRQGRQLRVRACMGASGEALAPSTSPARKPEDSDEASS